ncbi:unnamed protein product, partial [Phaeothamnion confervicola]
MQSRPSAHAPAAKFASPPLRLPPDLLLAAMRWLPTASRLRAAAADVAFRDAAYGSLAADDRLDVSTDHLTDNVLLWLVGRATAHVAVAAPAAATAAANEDGCACTAPPPIRALAVRSRRVTDAAVRGIVVAHGAALTELSLRGCSAVAEPVTALAVAAHCRRLEVLDLSGCGRRAPTLSLLTTAGTSRSQLERLVQAPDFQSYSLTDDVVSAAVMASAASLRVLRLAGCLAVTDLTAARAVAACPRLAELDLGAGARDGASGA